MMSRATLCLALVATQLVLHVAAQASMSANKLVDLISKKKYDAFIEELSAEGADANQPDIKGRLPLLEAVRTKEVKYVDALIQFGALANSRDPATKLSPVQFALQHGLVEITKLLLAYGADINAADRGNAKAREGVSGELKAIVAKWDEAGAQAFEDAPGMWSKATNDAGNKYWYNELTKESRWNVPPSCAWQKVEMQGQPHKYTNYVTAQTAHKLPNALAWRLIHQQGQDLWYNWRANTSQHARPDELPDDIYKALVAQKNVRWYNPKMKEFSWEDPKFLTPWRELKSEDGSTPYFFNVVTGETAWEAPEELAWKKVPSEEHPGHEFWHNPLTGESTWELPGIHGWEKHDSDIL